MVPKDFEKAFDTLEWHFLHNTLKYLNFGPNLRNWISVMYSDVESGIPNGGYVTNYFKISRGVRPGCPLSPILFVLSEELLAQKIRQRLYYMEQPRYHYQRKVSVLENMERAWGRLCTRSP